MHKHHSNKFLIGALVGSTVAALTTLLFSTQEGKKIQKKMMKKYHELSSKNGMFAHGYASLKKNIVKAERKVKRKVRGMHLSKIERKMMRKVKRAMHRGKK